MTVTPWFVAKDVCDALELFPNKINGSYQTQMRRLKEDERILATGEEPTVPKRRFSAISESGLYSLVLRSDKPEAKDFQDWVTRVVLPAIRKDGGYVMGEENVATGEKQVFLSVVKPPSKGAESHQGKTRAPCFNAAYPAIWKSSAPGGT